MAQQIPTFVALPLASAVLAAAASCGPRPEMNAAEARAKFSSKHLSLGGEAAAQVESEPPRTEVAAATPPATIAPRVDPEPRVAPVPAAEMPTAPETVQPVATTTATSDPAVGLELRDGLGMRDESLRILRLAATSDWPALRAHALEASIRNPPLLRSFAASALRDENRGVRFVACMSIAEARLTGFTEQLTPLLVDESASVRAACMLALARSGERVNLTPLATMVLDNDPEVRANAYLVLGELGNQSAVPMIRESIGRGMKLVNPLRVRLVDLAAAEALVKLGDEFEIEPIRAALFAPPEQGELTVVACDSVRRLGDEVARPMLERIISSGGESMRSPEIRLAAARALARLGGGKAPLRIASEYVSHPDARIRAQAAALCADLGAGPKGSAEALEMLAGLIRDENPSVQIAAAGGIGAAD
jgi:HEAT repeat protein